MKVAHVTTIDVSLRILLLNQLLYLKRSGFSLWGISAAGTFVSEIEAAGIKHIAIPMTRRVSPFRDLISLWKLYRTFRSERFSIVHTHNPKPSLLAQLAAKAAGVPIIVNTVHGYYFHDRTNPIVRRLVILFETIAARCSTFVLTQNREDLETAARERICNSRKLVFLGNGIDLKVFAPQRIEKEQKLALTQELGLSPENRIVGFVGRLAGTRKGVRDLLAAISMVRAVQPEVKLLLVGTADKGKGDAIGPNEIRAMGLGDLCVFAGWREQTEMPLLYSLMELLVLPSTFEGLPRAIMEASAMGIPVVATDVKGNREAVVDGETGILVPLGNPSALAETISTLLHDPELARQLGNAGRAYAIKNFDEEKVFERVHQVYLQAIECSTDNGRGHPNEAI